MNDLYLQTAKLLTAVAPHVFFDATFALKGGTAINLFMRDMPRLSVDLDLVFPDHTLQRDGALAKIAETLKVATKNLAKAGFKVRAAGAQDNETKLLVRREKIVVKIEVNYVMRGTVRPVATRELTEAASDALQADLELPFASPEDVYGGKLVAALDRQHPRDLFDVMQLMAAGGISPEIRRAFVVYLASHHRPIHEVLFPPMRDITQEFEANFAGMTAQEVTLAQLLQTREALCAELPAALDTDEKAFLLSLAEAKPQWERLSVPHAHELPAIRWKLENLQKLAATSPERFKQQRQELELRFG